MSELQTDPLIFTDHAAAKVWELIVEEGNPNLKLRVFVTGGGCSGFQYGFTFDETVNTDDTVIRKIMKDETDAEDEEGEGGEGSGSLVLGKQAHMGEEGEEGEGSGSLVQGKQDQTGEEGAEGSSTKTKEVMLLIDPMSFQYLVGAEIDYKEDVQGSQFVIRNPNATTTCGCGSSFSV